MAIGGNGLGEPTSEILRIVPNGASDLFAASRDRHRELFDVVRRAQRPSPVGGRRPSPQEWTRSG